MTTPGYPGAPAGGYQQDYDMAALYGMADHSAGYLYAEEWYDAVVEASEYGRTKDGSKGQWTIKFRTTTGQDAGRAPVTVNLSISPVKNDGSPNPAGLGIMFRQLAALGIPVPDPSDPSKTLNGPAPYWVQGWSNAQAAQAMVGRPAVIKIYHDEYDGVTRNKIRDIRPPRLANPPTTWPQQAQAQQQQQVQQGYVPPAPPQQPQNPYANPYAQQPPAPQGGFAPAPYGQQQPSGPWNPAAAGDPSATQPVPGAPNQWQAQPGQGWQNPQGGAPAGTQPPAQQVPGAPPWAQPGQPGQPGTGQFTQQGQAQQPQFQPGQNGQPQMPPQPPWQQAPGQPQQDPQQGGQAPWM